MARKPMTGLVIAALLIGPGSAALAAPQIDTVLVEGAVDNGDGSSTLYYGTVDVEESPGHTLQLACSNGETVEVDVADVKLVQGAQCTLTAVTVEAADEPVNHGSFVSAFTASLKASGWEGGVGCLVRWVAQSDFTDLPTELQVDAFPTACGPPTIDHEPSHHEASGGPPERVTEVKAERQALKAAWEGGGKPPWAGKPGPSADD